MGTAVIRLFELTNITRSILIFIHLIKLLVTRGGHDDDDDGDNNN